MVRPMSRETLARDAALRLAVSDIPIGACAGQGRTWSSLEHEHRQARTESATRALIEGVRRDFCDTCPALLACGQWAQVQAYTGLAAGAAYEKGKRKEATWVVGPGRRRAS
jgi:hypothetical protein